MADDEGVVKRERKSGIYRLSAYFLAVLTTEIPVVIIASIIYITVAYWMVKLTQAATNFIAFSFTALMLAIASEVMLLSTSC